MLEYPLYMLNYMSLYLIIDIASLVIMILGLIGVIYYGMFVYKIGKNFAQNLFVVGGILLIVYPMIGAILVSMAIKKVIKYNILNNT